MKLSLAMKGIPVRTIESRNNHCGYRPVGKESDLSNEYYPAYQYTVPTESLIGNQTEGGYTAKRIQTNRRQAGRTGEQSHGMEKQQRRDRELEERWPD